MNGTFPIKLESAQEQERERQWQRELALDQEQQQQGFEQLLQEQGGRRQSRDQARAKRLKVEGSATTELATAAVSEEAVAAAAVAPQTETAAPLPSPAPPAARGFQDRGGVSATEAAAAATAAVPAEAEARVAAAHVDPRMLDPVLLNGGRGGVPAADPRSFTGTMVADAPTPILSCTVTAGDPTAPLPSFMKSAPKPALQDYCRERGLAPTGTRSAMLERLQTEWPWVSLEVDAREPLQRLVAVVLSASAHLFGRGITDTHLFSLSSARGEWLYTGPAFDPAGGDDGFAEEVGARHTGRPIARLALQAGDRLTLSYDGDGAVVVVDAMRDAPSPPEQAFPNSCGVHSTHARILATGGPKPPARDENAHEDY
jgi:hypothetical protein